MPNRGAKRAACKFCGRPRMEGELFSARGKCPDCTQRRAREQNDEMRAHSGPYFDKWRRDMAAALGARLLDDPPERE